MPISGLVLTLSKDEKAAEKAFQALSSRGELECGAPMGGKLPAIADTPGADEDRELWKWMNDLPGVDFVDVVFIAFDEEIGNPDMEVAC